MKNLVSRRLMLAAMMAPTLRAGAPAADSGSAIAIVVRPDVPVDNLSFAELRRLMLGDHQYWSSNLKVTLLVRAPVARERDVVLKVIYQMSEAQFRQYWIAKVFRAEAAAAPRIVYSNDMAADMAAQIPGAVAFVNAEQVPPNGLKVVKINGMLPRDAGVSAAVRRKANLFSNLYMDSADIARELPSPVWSWYRYW